MPASAPASQPSRSRRAAALGAALAVALGAGALTAPARAEVSGPISSAGTTTLVSAGLGGAVPNGRSTHPELSSDGRFVVFDSEASNLVSGDDNGVRDVFWRDQLTGETRIVSRADGADGELGDGTSGAGFNAGEHHTGISADGRYVAFLSAASNLVAGDDNGVTDVFVRDVVAGRTLLVSGTGAGAVVPEGAQGDLAISGDGRFVAFASRSEELAGAELVESFGLNALQVLRWNRRTGRTVLVSRTDDGTPAETDASGPVISDDGSKVGFVTAAENLGGLPSVESPRPVFLVRDVVRARTTVESRAVGPDGEVQSSASGLMAGDGTHVAWADTNAKRLFVRDLATGATEQAAVLTGGELLPGFCCFNFAISADARFIAAHAEDGDENNTIYLRDRATGITEIVNRPTGAEAEPLPSNGRDGVAISDDGRFVAFSSDAPDLAPDDFSSGQPFPFDAFVRDVTGPPALAPAIGRGTQDPTDLLVSVGCGAALCEGVLTGKVVARRSAGGAGRQVFALEEAAAYAPGGLTVDVPLDLAGGDAAVEELVALLADPDFVKHSRLVLTLDVTGEAGAASTTARRRLVPTPVVTPKVRLSATPKRDRTAPFAYRLTGRLAGSFAKNAATCDGTVRIAVKQGTRALAKKKAAVTDACRFGAEVTIAAAKIEGKSPVRLKVVARYGGNGGGPVVLEAATKRLRVRAG
ncbi:hypothetical protein [Nocardioides sp. YIM 152588]|uniref:hypothetical protein n=1 Tax=Nocardioides sp. YIM 152588 TaxID=3158259 RepID=UPI0032E4FA23